MHNFFKSWSYLVSKDVCLLIVSKVHQIIFYSAGAVMQKHVRTLDSSRKQIPVMMASILLVPKNDEVSNTMGQILYFWMTLDDLK